MCLREFANGHAVQNAFEAGDFLPRLTLYNLQDGAAVVKLVRRETDVAHLYFIAPQSSAVISEVAPGQYIVSFAVEPRLEGDCETLLDAERILRFDAEFDLYRRVTQRSDGSIYIEAGDSWATLHDSEGGSASSTRLSVDEFNR